MKRINWLYGAVVLGMLSACTSDDVPKNNDGTQPGETGSGYMGISLQLPTEPNTRANNDLNDGTPAEYVVNNAAILLFQGDSEADAQFLGAYEVIPSAQTENPDDDQITVSFNKAIELNSKPVTSDGQLWGLAIVNYSATDFLISEGNLTVGATDAQFILTRKNGTTAGTTFNAFREKITKENYNFLQNGFFMTNAPLCDKQGTSVAVQDGYNIQTLAKLDINKIFSSKSQAEAAPSGCIFVERAVAKITCSTFPEIVELKEGEDVKSKLTITSVKWALDNEEPTSYIVRNTQTNIPATPTNLWKLSNTVNGNTYYRFVGGLNMSNNGFNDGNATEHDKWYRTYWCQDPSYTNGREYNDMLTAPIYKELKSGDNLNPFYPKENTFDLQYQNHKNTTRVIFEVTYQLENNEENQNLYLVEGIENVIFNETTAKNKLMEGVLASPVLKQYLQDNLAETVEYNANDFKVTYKKNGIYYQIESLDLGDKFKLKEGAAEFSTVAPSCITAGNSNYNIIQFEGGKCYYAAYIHHFGDDYCPYPASSITGTTTDAVYKTDGNWDYAKWLGRWGLVRNNWYDLEITIIRNMGSAVPPEGNTTISDDSKEEKFFIAAHVHMLSWAKRTQKHEF